ncbi:MAG TPA: VTT domain-containing protein, partial [Planctomycetota bacterium]|nr:VTT domain-containing protein [Planctomycetota bacterium]
MSECPTPPLSRRRGPGLLLLILVGLLLALAAAAYHPAVRDALGGWSPTGIRDMLLSFGPWAWAFSALLMIGQANVSPLPAFVITIANGYVFGWFWGGVLALLSATLAAQICFEIARALGRPAVERWVDARVLRWADGVFRRHGVWAVLIARLLPF